MEFTKENWENAPKGAKLEYNRCAAWNPVTLVGFTSTGGQVIESLNGNIWRIASDCLRIVLPKRKVTVQLWESSKTGELESTFSTDPITGGDEWTLLGEHTFEIERE